VAKPKPTTVEALLLARLKRARARESLAKIVKRLAQISNEPEAGLEVLLDYLNSMVQAIELLLKVLSNDWQTHDVAEMHRTVFGRDHQSPQFMQTLFDAIKNQKYLFGPAPGLIDYIPEMEVVWDELVWEFDKQSGWDIFSHFSDVSAPPSLVEFLGSNIARFLDRPVYRSVPVIPREELIRINEHRIRELEKENDRIRNTPEPEQLTRDEIHKQLQAEWEAKVDSARMMFQMNMNLRKGELLFSIGIGSMGSGIFEK
jgi:hypothetical protein